MEMNCVNPCTLRKFIHPKPVDTDVWGIQTHHESVSAQWTPRPRSREDINIDRSSGMRNMVTPTRSAWYLKRAVGRPQGTHNTSAGMGCSQKRMPVAERQGENITRRIGHMTSPKGR